MRSQRAVVHAGGRDGCRRARSRLAVTMVAGLAATLLTGIGPSASAAASPEVAVLDWNMHAYHALGNPPTAAVPGAGQPPPVAVLHLAMVQGAVYDAVNSIAGGYQPYLSGLPTAVPTASQAAAVATAAHHVLVGVVMAPPLSPAIVDRLNGLYAESLADIPDGPDRTAGIAAGEAAAAAMLAARSSDGRYVAFSFPIGSAPGQWRPTPPANVNDPFAWVARVDPFALESTSQFRTRGPLPVTGPAYAREYAEVKELGTAGSPRDPEQEAVAQFYTVNPVELFNRTFRTIADGLTLADQARLFARVNLAGADALINCWDDKAHWHNWRPITAIQLGDHDGNPRTVGDPSWTPLIATPPYPDHSSGYNCVTAAMMYTARDFFGTNHMSFSVVRVAPGVPDVSRDYERLTDVVDDTIDARVYQGIHFRTADTQGARLGRNVAGWLDGHFFQRIR